MNDVLARIPIAYYSNVVNEPDVLFNALWNELDWVRIENTPRREYYYNPTGESYTYGRGRGIRTYHSQNNHPAIAELWSLAEQVCKTTFDVVFLNGYENQLDHLGWHADDSPEMDDSRPIAIISLGAERDTMFRKAPFDNGRCVACSGSGYYDHNGSPKCSACNGTGREEAPESFSLPLGHGSLCMMRPGMQDTHQHRIPKAGRTVGQRISLTFRGTV